jgi:hypothetical protein
MRIISQDLCTDVNYDNVRLSICSRKNEKFYEFQEKMTDKKGNINWDSIKKTQKEMGETSWNKRYYNYSIESTFNENYNYIATYSTKERALEVMEEIRNTYCKIENVYQRVRKEAVYFYMSKE